MHGVLFLVALVAAIALVVLLGERPVRFLLRPSHEAAGVFIVNRVFLVRAALAMGCSGSRGQSSRGWSSRRAFGFGD